MQNDEHESCFHFHLLNLLEDTFELEGFAASQMVRNSIIVHHESDVQRKSMQMDISLKCQPYYFNSHMRMIIQPS